MQFKTPLLFSACMLLSLFASSQDNYEIQVYGSETMAARSTMLELHSNFTFEGTRQAADGLYPTQHIFHETLEITHGFNPWFETGFYIFNALGSGGRTAYVGSHIRPRIRIPESWSWPVGLSLSAEVGYQKPKYCADDWTLEIRPIIDRTVGRTYFALNPSFGKSLHGRHQQQGFDFSPNVKGSYSLRPVWALGLEYYGAMGTLFRFLPASQQEHQLFITADIKFSPRWECNLGYGHSLTRTADNSIAKMILGYRFGQ